MSAGFCLICGGADNCAASKRAAALLPPGTPVRVRYPASEGGKTFVGVAYGEPGYGVSHWFVGVTRKAGTLEGGGRWMENTAVIPAEYVTPIDAGKLPPELAALPPEAFNPYGVRDSIRDALGWSS